MDVRIIHIHQAVRTLVNWLVLHSIRDGVPRTLRDIKLRVTARQFIQQQSAP